MGFSGEDGSPVFADLLQRLQDTEGYEPLFTDVFGNGVVTEERMQLALAQFIRSMQSFDSKYDVGRASSSNDNVAFANFSALENEGKRLFLQRPDFDNGIRVAGTGLGCNGCHRAPAFDIDPRSRNNGVIGVAGNALAIDTSNTRSPSLRDVFNPAGQENGPFMHDGSLATFADVIEHYNAINHDQLLNPNLDNRLRGNAAGGRGEAMSGQRLQMTQAEREALTAFMKTLTGSAVYTDARWADPFVSE